MKKKQEIVSYHHFKKLLEEFVPDYFSSDGCSMCNERATEIIPNDFNDGKYDRALKELYVSLLK